MDSAEWVCRSCAIVGLMLFLGCPCRDTPECYISKDWSTRKPAVDGLVSLKYTMDAVQPDPLPIEASAVAPDADPGTAVEEDVALSPLPEEAPIPPVEAPILLLSEADQLALIEEVSQMRNDLDVLRRQVDMLEHNAQVVTTGTVSRLSEENRQLRRELQRLYTGAAPGTALSAPSGGFGAEPDLPSEASDVQEASLRPVMAVAGSAESGLSYTVVKEWGVTPDQNTDGPGILASKGLICAVAPTASEDDLRLLATRLRNEYGMYERVTIDVFNDQTAARAYVEENASPGTHRVLSVVKDPATGRDSAILFRNGEAVELAQE